MSTDGNISMHPRWISPAAWLRNPVCPAATQSPQLLHLDIISPQGCSPTPVAGTEHYTHSQNCSGLPCFLLPPFCVEILKRQDRLCWSGAECAQTSALASPCQHENQPFYPVITLLPRYVPSRITYIAHSLHLLLIS